MLPANTDLIKINNLIKELRNEFEAFILTVGRFKQRLPREKFMNSLDETRKNIQRTVNIVNLGDENNLKKFAFNAKQASDSCIKSFGYCEQRLKIGHFVAYFSAALGILARLNTLCKAIALISTQTLYKMQVFQVGKRADGKHILVEYGSNLIEEMGYEQSYLNEITSVGETQENFTSEDLGEVISRENMIQPPVRPPRKKKTASVPEKTVQKPKNKKKKFLKDLKSRISTVTDLKSFRLALSESLKVANKAQIKQIEKISRQFEVRVTKLKLKRKEIEANLNAARSKMMGYREIEDSESTFNYTTKKSGKTKKMLKRLYTVKNPKQLSKVVDMDQDDMEELISNPKLPRKKSMKKIIKKYAEKITLVL